MLPNMNLAEQGQPNSNLWLAHFNYTILVRKPIE